MADTFDAEKFREVDRKARAAEDFIVQEAAKMGIELSAGQARIFANAALKAYGVV